PVLALPGDGGLRLEPRDPNLSELAQVAGERRRVAAFGPQLGWGLDQGSACLVLCHGSSFRPGGRDSFRGRRLATAIIMRSTTQLTGERTMTRKLGRRGPETSTVGLGCMGMSGMYGSADEQESIATI